MRNPFGRIAIAWAIVAVLFVRAQQADAQVTRTGGEAPPDDTSKVNVGITLFADYSYQETPTITDADRNVIHKSSFNLARGYINVTGTLSHWFSFRVTPDIRAETGSGSSLSGSQTFRMKYGYGQVNFDDFATRGTWLRLGLQQTPWIDYEEGIYRYRFQGPIFADVEGFLTSSDYGASVHYVFPANYGDVHLGVYNGEGYQSVNDQNGVNNQKSLQIRASMRPAPAVPVVQGLRVTGYYDTDHYLADAKRERFIASLTFEHSFVHAGAEYLEAKDQTSVTRPELARNGFSLWATPRTPFGLEALLRYDELDQNRDASPRPKKKRMVAGLAYWPPLSAGKSVAFLVDYSEVRFDNVTPDPGSTKIYALHTLFNF